MKKIVCPRCGVVNLEKFVTFPHCAGCSAMLPLAREPQLASVWRRPLWAGLWASLVGLALAGVVALSFSTSEPGEPESLGLYAQMPRRVQLGRALVCRLRVESIRADGRDVETLREVSWQIPLSTLRDWRVVGISPTPDSQGQRGGRPVWNYRRWPADGRWSLSLQPRARGRRALAVSASAEGHFPAQWRTIVAVN